MELRNLVNWDRPFGIPVRQRASNAAPSFAALQEEMNRVFERFYSGAQVYLTDWDKKIATTPAVNILENGDSFRVEADLAGMDPKQVDIEVANGFLTLKGERTEEKEEKGENYLCHEIAYGAFYRTIALPEAADGDRAKAAFKNGILTVTVPKKPEAMQKPKKIEIRTAA